VNTSTGPVQIPRDEFFNARFYVSIPALNGKIGNLYTTIAYEAPTSTIARNDDMRFGWVLTQSYALNFGISKWSAGLMWQYYRAYYEQNISPSPIPRTVGFSRQTVIFSGGPYASYRMNDRWLLGSVVTFDWDQRGLQTETSEWNNNLPDRARLNLTYFPKMKHFSSVGLFTQALLKYSPQSHALGGELSLRF
jgi:hypothetical protein